ncbi:MAG: hypothetical protein LRY63_02465 [Nitrincola sp.]|nr:hypothetical protein [Nitrincola sp.]
MVASTAIASHAVAMVNRIAAGLNAQGLRAGPVCLVSQGRHQHQLNTTQRNFILPNTTS